MILYRHTDPRFPFLWEGWEQPLGRWHSLRHEGITQEVELANVRRSLWAVDAPDDLLASEPNMPPGLSTAGMDA